MSEMRERVAAAIRDELRKIGYGVGTINADQLAAALSGPAIAAMRAPTAAMMLSKNQPTWTLGRPMGEWWEAMIDAALATEEASHKPPQQ